MSLVGKIHDPSLPRVSLKIDSFEYADGTRECFSEWVDNKLCVRARRLPDGQAVALNLDEAGAERLGITLCKFLELSKINRKDTRK